MNLARYSSNIIWISGIILSTQSRPTLCSLTNKKGRMIPEEVKIIIKNRAVQCTNRLEPCVDAKNPAKMTNALI